MLSARVIYQLLYGIGWADAGPGQGIDLLQDLAVLVDAEIDRNPTVCFVVVSGFNFRAGRRFSHSLPPLDH